MNNNISELKKQKKFDAADGEVIIHDGDTMYVNGFGIGLIARVIVTNLRIVVCRKKLSLIKAALSVGYALADQCLRKNDAAITEHIFWSDIESVEKARYGLSVAVLFKSKSGDTLKIAIGGKPDVALVEAISKAFGEPIVGL